MMTPIIGRFARTFIFIDRSKHLPASVSHYTLYGMITTIGIIMSYCGDVIGFVIYLKFQERNLQIKKLLANHINFIQLLVLPLKH